MLHAGDVPRTIRFRPGPKTCTYTSPNGDVYDGVVRHVSPPPEDLNMYQLAERSRFAGFTWKVKCVELTLKVDDPSTPEDPKQSPAANNSTQSATGAKIAACVDRLFPHAPSSIQQHHIRRAMQSQAAAGRKPAAGPATAHLADYSSGDDSYGPEYQLPSEPDVRVELTDITSTTTVTVVYTGSPTDRGALDPFETCELPCLLPRT